MIFSLGSISKSFIRVWLRWPSFEDSLRMICGLESCDYFSLESHKETMYLEDACFESSSFSVDGNKFDFLKMHTIPTLKQVLTFYYHSVWTKRAVLLTDDGIMAAVGPV